MCSTNKTVIIVCLVYVDLKQLHACRHVHYVLHAIISAAATTLHSLSDN